MICSAKDCKEFARVLPIVILVASSLFGKLPAETFRELPRRPNIVFLLADDVNRDSLGVYGNPDCLTPHIDLLASEGVRFDHAYASVAMCAPFRQELYSGRSPWRTGTLANHSTSSPETKSIPHYLKPLGYRVALIGKSHVGPASAYPFEYFPRDDKTIDQNPFFVMTVTKVIDECLERDQPFCIFIASDDGHAPYTTGNSSFYRETDLRVPDYWLNTPELREELSKYYAEVSNFDRLVGQIREKLEERDLWENTIYVVSTEQGSAFPFSKWTCYKNGLSTGLVVSWPRLISSGFVCEQLVSIADVAPTLVMAAGGAFDDADFDGISLMATLQGDQKELRESVLGAFTNCNIIGSRNRIFPIRVIRSKLETLIWNPNFEQTTSNLTIDDALAILRGRSPERENVATSWVRKVRECPEALTKVWRLNHRTEYEYYDLRSDPFELDNQICNPGYKERVMELKRELHAQLTKLGDDNPIATEKGLAGLGE